MRPLEAFVRYAHRVEVLPRGAGGDENAGQGKVRGSGVGRVGESLRDSHRVSERRGYVGAFFSARSMAVRILSGAAMRPTP